MFLEKYNQKEIAKKIFKSCKIYALLKINNTINYYHCTVIREFNYTSFYSRKWSREQKSAGSPVYGYIQGGIPGTLPGKIN